jgi:hypothetical protein
MLMYINYHFLSNWYGLGFGWLGVLRRHRAPRWLLRAAVAHLI